MMNSRSPQRAAARLGIALCLLLLLSAPAAFGQEALRIAQEVEEIIETPHPTRREATR